MVKQVDQGLHQLRRDGGSPLRKHMGPGEQDATYHPWIKGRSTPHVEIAGQTMLEIEVMGF
jgi:hypothetical protein